ncbi:MAG: NAD-dependent epimerase/dehydratase family protein [Promethearchaeota archaeon]
MKILITGAFGNVGLSTLRELIKKDHNVRVIEIKNKKNKKLAKEFKSKVEIIWGDLRDYNDVEKAIAGQDLVIHLAAIIPPLADHNLELARAVNVGATKNILNAIKKQDKQIKLIFTSSIAVYGDRRMNPMINVKDHLNPSLGDFYALTKILAEKAIRESGITFAIFRLTYITSINKLDMDPLMFHMPLDTSIEICDTKDVGLALSNAVDCNQIWGETFHIAGGMRCRTTYREYLNMMMQIFGLGENFLPEQAFAKKDFHCGYMDTEKSQSLLKYQNHTLEDYFNEVVEKFGVKKHLLKIFKKTVKFHLLKSSEPYRRFKFFKSRSGAFTVSENKFIRKLLSTNYEKIDLLETRIIQLEKLIHETIQNDKKAKLFAQIENI